MHAMLGSTIPGGWVGDERTESRNAHQPYCIPLHFCYCCQMNWWLVEQRVINGFLDLRRVHSYSMGRWTLSGADVQTLWHGVLETVWLHCDEVQHLDACEDWKVVCWCRTQASSHNSQGVVDGGVSEAGVSTAAPDRSAVLCCWMH